jgi:uncharacterized protein YggU (UPF0235/DUF167 family)
MLHVAMASVTVRVIPRSRRSAIEPGAGVLVVRVRAPAEAGRANEEARRALADAVGVPASAVRLRVGARARTKVFDVEGVTPAELERRLAAG